MLVSAIIIASAALVVVMREVQRLDRWYGDTPYKPLITPENVNKLPKMPSGSVFSDSVLALLFCMVAVWALT